MDDTLTIIGHPNSIQRRRATGNHWCRFGLSWLSDATASWPNSAEAAKIITISGRLPGQPPQVSKAYEITLLGDRTYGAQMLIADLLCPELNRGRCVSWSAAKSPGSCRRAFAMRPRCLVLRSAPLRDEYEAHHGRSAHQ